MTPTDESEERNESFVEYLEGHLARRNWTIDQLAEKSGMSPSVIFRWRHGYVPNIKNARLFAKAVGVPVLDVLIKSGQITREEAGGKLFTLDEIDTPVLARELTRRIEAAAERAKQISEQVEPGSDAGIDDWANIIAAAMGAARTQRRPRAADDSDDGANAQLSAT